MKLPDPCGPLSTAVVECLREVEPTSALRTAPEPGDDRDRELALWILQELSYRGFEDAPDAMETDLDVLALLLALEADLERGLREAWAASGIGPTLDAALEAFDDAPSVAEWIRTDATTEGVAAFLRERSVYHLKEADPHFFTIPRLEPGPKAALVELQYDELGGGRPERVHQQLFADAMAAAGLDASYGAYVGEASTATLRGSTALTMLCRQRRLRHAALGHLAAFETTSSLPCAAIVRGLRRLGMDETVVAYYDEHVEADAVHEEVVRHDIVGRVLAAEPEAADEVAFGAFVCLELERRAAVDFLPAVDA